MSEGFEGLKVWQRAKNLAVSVCRESERIRNMSIRDQVIRSAISVPSNIAEGAERNSKAEFAQFVSIARGSCGELRAQLMIVAELKLIPSDLITPLVKESAEISRMLFALGKTLRKPSDE